MLDEESRKNIEELEAQTGKPTGIGQIERSECPVCAFDATACTFCLYGHMLHCHYPMTCEQAGCSDWDEPDVSR